MSGAKKPVLAVDFDEVCVGYVASFIEFNNATYKTDLKVEDFDTYCFWLVPKCQLAVKEDATDRVYEFHATPFFDTVAPIPGTHEALKALAERYELHVVTSRQTDIEQATRDYAAKHFPGVFTELHFGNHFGKTGGKMSKPDMCKNIGAVALIDDSIDYARGMAEAGIPCLLFGEYGWNRGETDPLIRRVADWDAVKRTLLDAPFP